MGVIYNIMVHVVRPSVCHTRISSKSDIDIWQRKLEWETGLPGPESVIRFAIGSTVPPFWVFPGWHFAHSERGGSVSLVNVVNGSVEQSLVGSGVPWVKLKVGPMGWNSSLCMMPHFHEDPNPSVTCMGVHPKRPQTKTAT